MCQIQLFHHSRAYVCKLPNVFVHSQKLPFRKVALSKLLNSLQFFISPFSTFVSIGLIFPALSAQFLLMSGNINQNLHWWAKYQLGPCRKKLGRIKRYALVVSSSSSRTCRQQKSRGAGKKYESFVARGRKCWNALLTPSWRHIWTIWGEELCASFAAARS